jgi:hypothetical protein
MNPPGLTASASRSLTTGAITVTLGSTAAIPTGIPPHQAEAQVGKPETGDFNPSYLNSTEAAKLDYFIFELKGLTGGVTGTRIKQTNGALIIYKNKPLYTVVGPPSPWNNGEIYEHDGIIEKQKFYTGAQALGLSFDFNIPIAKGKGPVTLVITPDEDISKQYTVTINYDSVTFSGKGVPVDGDIDDYVEAPTTSGYNTYGAVTLSVSELTKQEGTSNYTAKVTPSANTPIGGGDVAANIPNSTKGEMAYPGSWTGDAVAKTNVMTLNFVSNSDLFAGISTAGAADITIKQVNPALAVYEGTVHAAGNYVTSGPKVPVDADGCYDVSPHDVFKWSGQYNPGSPDAGGHILYKVKNGYDLNSDLANFNFAIRDLGNDADEVVIFTFEFAVDASPPQPDDDGTHRVSRSLKVDYSGVKF